VADHIDANLGRELRLGELSGVVHMSPFHFARLFKRTSGVPPHRFVVRRRVDRAIELLAGGEHPIGEIARLVGFGTPSHFTTVFRRITGVTPTEYRRGRGERTGRIRTEGAMRPPEVVTQLRHHHVGPMARPDEVLVEGLRRRGDRGGGGAGGRMRGPGLTTRRADHRQSIGCGAGHAGRALGRGAQDSPVPGSRGLRLPGVPHHRERGLPEGGEAGEVVAAVQSAMLTDLSYPKVGDAILAHPTMAEGLGDLFVNVPPR
jgi:AraC-like DNA-binding protein